jgi:hypothetical protein
MTRIVRFRSFSALSARYHAGGIGVIIVVQVIGVAEGIFGKNKRFGNGGHAGTPGNTEHEEEASHL